jgi:hypothetical protein
VIDLLPPSIKEQVAFSKKSVKVLRYFKLALFVAILLGGIFAAADWYLGTQISAKQKQADEEQSKVAQYAGLQSQVKSLNSKLTTISNVTKSQSKFSELLADFGSHMPKGAYISGMALNGDDSKPLTVTCNANSYQSAVAVRTGLLGSSRVAAIDVNSVTFSNNEWHVDVLVKFKPGEAK